MIMAVPAMNVMTMVEMRTRLLSGIRSTPGSRLPERASATMPVDCRIARPTVR